VYTALPDGITMLSYK